MRVEVPPAPEDPEEGPTGTLPPDVEEVLRRLLVGELKVKVDPISGRALPDRDGQWPEDHP